MLVWEGVPTGGQGSIRNSKSKSKSKFPSSIVQVQIKDLKGGKGSIRNSPKAKNSSRESTWKKTDSFKGVSRDCTGDSAKDYTKDSIRTSTWAPSTNGKWTPPSLLW